MCIIYDTLHLGETFAHRHDQHALCSFTFPFCVALTKTICSPKDTKTSDEGNVQFVAAPRFLFSPPFSIRLAASAPSVNCVV